MIIDNILVELETKEVMNSLKLTVNAPAAVKKIEGLIEIIVPVMRPKTVYSKSRIELLDQNRVALEGNIFHSQVLVKNLQEQEYCYPYIVTAGHELDEIKLPTGQSFMLLDLIKNLVVQKAFEYTKDLISERYSLSDLTDMNPGHINDWPLSEQRVLFNLLGSEVDKVGVRLTDSFLMIPIKTVSGILFTSETGFQSCKVCEQPRCMGRRAAYDPVIAKKYGL